MKSMPVIFARRADRAPLAAPGCAPDSILLASPGDLPPDVALPALHTVRKYYRVGRDDGSPLTGLSNVVAYPCHKVEQ
jgi:hypothetical protein